MRACRHLLECCARASAALTFESSIQTPSCCSKCLFLTTSQESSPCAQRAFLSGSATASTYTCADLRGLLSLRAPCPANGFAYSLLADSRLPCHCGQVRERARAYSPTSLRSRPAGCPMQLLDGRVPLVRRGCVAYPVAGRQARGALGDRHARPCALPLRVCKLPLLPAPQLLAMTPTVSLAFHMWPPCL